MVKYRKKTKERVCLAMDAEQRIQIETLYFEMFDKLKTYANSSLQNESMAEEAVQETFRIACQRPEALCECPNPQGWLVLALKNTIRNIRKNQATAKRIIEQYMLAEYKEQAVSMDDLGLDTLYGNIAQTEDFKLLYEMAVEGRNHEEMAAARGINVVTCRKRVQRAKEKLHKKIKW